MKRKEFIEVAGLAAIVASLIFVGLQLRQSEDIGVAEGYAAYFSHRLETSNSIKEHIEIWAKGVAGEKLNEDESAVFAILVNQVNESAIQGFLYTKEVAGIQEAQILAQDFAIFLYLNPGARVVWNEREGALAAIRSPLTGETEGHPWTTTVRSYLAELDRRQPQIDVQPFVTW